MHSCEVKPYFALHSAPLKFLEVGIVKHPSVKAGLLSGSVLSAVGPTAPSGGQIARCVFHSKPWNWSVNLILILWRSLERIIFIPV